MAEACVIREESAGDEAGIHALIAASFPTAAEARLVDRLRAAGRLPVSCVALRDDRIVGHVGFSPVTAGDSTGAGLAPLAVIAEHRRCGIGAALVRAGLAGARGAGFEWVVVLGDPAYYSRFGFRPASEYGLRDPFGGGEAFQVLELVPGRSPRGTGLVLYAPEFDGLEEG